MNLDKVKSNAGGLVVILKGCALLLLMCTLLVSLLYTGVRTGVSSKPQ